MSFFDRTRLVLFLLLFSLSAHCLAGRMDPPVSRFDSDYEDKPWAEVEVQLPAFPEVENLIPFTVGANHDTQYEIDSLSLSVGSDDVIRFSLVITSSMGAKSISYEGMRCSTAERRFYASGRSDKTWSKARSNQWVKIKGGSNNHHFELFTNYFCPIGSAPVADVEGAARALRQGGISKSKR